MQVWISLTNVYTVCTHTLGYKFYEHQGSTIRQKLPQQRGNIMGLHRACAAFDQQKALSASCGMHHTISPHEARFRCRGKVFGVASRLSHVTTFRRAQAGHYEDGCWVLLEQVCVCKRIFHCPSESHKHSAVWTSSYITRLNFWLTSSLSKQFAIEKSVVGSVQSEILIYNDECG